MPDDFDGLKETLDLLESSVLSNRISTDSLSVLASSRLDAILERLDTIDGRFTESSFGVVDTLSRLSSRLERIEEKMDDQYEGNRGWLELRIESRLERIEERLGERDAEILESQCANIAMDVASYIYEGSSGKAAPARSVQEIEKIIKQHSDRSNLKECLARVEADVAVARRKSAKAVEALCESDGDVISRLHAIEERLAGESTRRMSSREEYRTDDTSLAGTPPDPKGDERLMEAVSNAIACCGCGADISHHPSPLPSKERAGFYCSESCRERHEKGMKQFCGWAGKVAEASCDDEPVIFPDDSKARVRVSPTCEEITRPIGRGGIVPTKCPWCEEPTPTHESYVSHVSECESLAAIVTHDDKPPDLTGEVMELAEDLMDSLGAVPVGDPGRAHEVVARPEWVMEAAREMAEKHVWRTEDYAGIIDRHRPKPVSDEWVEKAALDIDFDFGGRSTRTRRMIANSIRRHLPRQES